MSRARIAVVADAGAREAALEAAFLKDAARRADVALGGFSEAVAARLERGQERFADSWTTRSVADLLAEIAEEGIDAAGWAVLALQRAKRDNLSGEDFYALRELLVQVAAYGAAIDAITRLVARVAEPGLAA